MALRVVEEVETANQADYYFKVVLIGDYGVREYKLLSKFMNISSANNMSSMVGGVTVQIDGKTIEVQILDTVGQMKYNFSASFQFRAAKGVMLIYDITQYSTFQTIRQWFVVEIQYHIKPDTVVMLVGTNCHKEHLRAVPTEEAKAYAEKNGLHFFETSALHGTNVEQAFMHLITEIYTKVTPKRKQEQMQNKETTELLEHKDSEQTFKFSEWATGSKNTQKSNIISEFIEQMANDIHQKYMSGAVSMNDLPSFEHINEFGSLNYMYNRDEILFYVKSMHESLKKYFTHLFEGHTYLSLPNCEHCGKKLKGFFRRGVKCRECGINCHKQCMDSVVVLCTKYKNDKTSPETVTSMSIVDELSTEEDSLPPENEGSTQGLFDNDLAQQGQQRPIETLEIKQHPKDTTSKPGERVEFSVKAEPAPSSYKWYFQRVIAISPTNEEFEGASTDCLVIKKCLPKHKGTYECHMTDESGQMVVISLWASLKIDGKVIEAEESKLLEEILRKSNIDLSPYGIKLEQLNELTYEEVQYSLKEHPGTHFLSQNLKDQLKSKLNDERLYKEAIANDTSVSVAYVKILALGPGQVGKSTFLYRLMGLMDGNIQTAYPETLPQASTGITEQREVCIIQYTSRTGALTSNNQWQLFDESTELKTQLGGLMSLISEQSSKPNPSPKSNDREHHESKDNQRVISPDKSSLPEHPILTGTFNDGGSSKQSEYKKIATMPNPIPANVVTESNLLQCKTDIEAVISEFEVIHEETNLSQTQIQFDILLNIADIGGQPAFLEMLPSLTIGPALYLVFMNLLQGLDTKYPVVFKSRENRKQVLCQNYTYTSEEIIFTALSSIASFGNCDEEVEAYVLKDDHQLTETLISEDANQQTNSLALLVGTFADQVSSDEIEAIHSKIKQLVQETKFYTEGLLYDTKLLLVNNFSGKTSEIEEQRSLIECLLREKFRKYQIPARWLMFSICLKLVAKKLNNFELSFNACVDIGHRFGMTEETVRAALKFLHKYIGLVMYFPNNPRLKDVVICDPQIVFTSVSELIFDIYNPNKNYLPEAAIDDFIKTGCFSPQDIKLQSFNSRNTLSLDTIIELLVYLNIAAEVPLSTDDSSIQRRKYFLPAVLQTADTSLVQSERVGENDELLPEPLCIQFVTGYLPLGFVCALSANLMANNNLLQLVPFRENDQLITYKNMMRFRYNGEIDIIMLSGPKYCEFRIKRCSRNSKIEFWDSSCCPLIKTIITEAAESVVQSMHHGDSVYKLSNCFDFGFKCPEHKNVEVGHEPLAEFIYELSVTNTGTVNKEPTRIQCKGSLCRTSSPVTPNMKMWFGKEILATPLNILKEPTFRENVFKMSAEGTRPLNYQWYKDDEELTDGCDYKGTNGPELFVRNLVPQVKGVYYCRVTDKQNHSILTQNVEFDPFKAELKLAKLEDPEIHALIDVNGFRSIQELRTVCLKDIDGLKTTAEKIRISKFLEMLHQQHNSASGSTLELKLLRDVFWEVRAKWYLLGIQLEVNHSNLEVSRKKREVYDQYMFVLTSFLSSKDPLPSWFDVKQALESKLIGCHSFDLSPEVQEKLQQLPDDRPTPDSGKPNKAAQLKRVLTALWEVRAQWRRLAGEVEGITEGDCEAISINHSSVEECFAALLDRCLTIHKDSAQQVLIGALQSKVFGRHDIADEFSTLT